MLTEEQIAALKAAHGTRLGVVETPIGDMVFSAPSRAVYDKWNDDIQSGKPRSECHRYLAQNCLVFPAYDAFMAILDSLPGILSMEVVNACTLHSGTVDKYEVKKL